MCDAIAETPVARRTWAPADILCLIGAVVLWLLLSVGLAMGRQQWPEGGSDD